MMYIGTKEDGDDNGDSNNVEAVGFDGIGKPVLRKMSV